MRKPANYGYLKPLMILVISLLIISSSSFIIEDVEASGEELPTWVEGDYWHYNKTFERDTQDDVTFRSEVTSEEEYIDIDNEMFECYMVNYTWIIDQVPETETHFYTKEGLSLVAEITPDGTFAYNPTVKLFDFPLEGGKEWTSAAIRWRMADDEEWQEGPRLNLRFTIEGKTTVEVPAGTFETYIINMTGADENGGQEHILNYYSPEVKNMVLREEYQYNVLMNTEELTEYNLEERTEDDDEIPYLGTGVFTLSIAASALIYLSKSKIKENNHK